MHRTGDVLAASAIAREAIGLSALATACLQYCCLDLLYGDPQYKTICLSSAAAFPPQ